MKKCVKVLAAVAFVIFVATTLSSCGSNKPPCPAYKMHTSLH
ncbi:MAG: hypothetical protein RIS47_360 [Bacteroidota bacterium]|jgi:hypothetical protein